VKLRNLKRELKHASPSGVNSQRAEMYVHEVESMCTEIRQIATIAEEVRNEWRSLWNCLPERVEQACVLVREQAELGGIRDPAWLPSIRDDLLEHQKQLQCYKHIERQLQHLSSLLMEHQLDRRIPGPAEWLAMAQNAAPKRLDQLELFVLQATKELTRSLVRAFVRGDAPVREHLAVQFPQELTTRAWHTAHAALALSRKGPTDLQRQALDCLDTLVAKGLWTPPANLVNTVLESVLKNGAWRCRHLMRACVSEIQVSKLSDYSVAHPGLRRFLREDEHCQELRVRLSDAMEIHSKSDPVTKEQILALADLSPKADVVMDVLESTPHSSVRIEVYDLLREMPGKAVARRLLARFPQETEELQHALLNCLSAHVACMTEQERGMFNLAGLLMSGDVYEAGITEKDALVALFEIPPRPRSLISLLERGPSPQVKRVIYGLLREMPGKAVARRLLARFPQETEELQHPLLACLHSHTVYMTNIERQLFALAGEWLTGQRWQWGVDPAQTLEELLSLPCRHGALIDLLESKPSTKIRAAVYALLMEGHGEPDMGRLLGFFPAEPRDLQRALLDCLQANRMVATGRDFLLLSLAEKWYSGKPFLVRDRLALWRVRLADSKKRELASFLLRRAAQGGR